MSRARIPLAIAALLAAASLPAGAAGTITTAGSTIGPGTAPVQGALTIDASAAPATSPAVPSPGSLGAIGSISGSLPAFPAITGTPLPLITPGANLTLAAGTYLYPSFTVQQGFTITCTGAVTIQTVTDVTIHGLVTSATAGASISFQCGGNFQVVSHLGGFRSGVTTTSPASPIAIDVAGNLTTSSADGSIGLIDATAGSVSLTSHATTGGVLTLANMTVRSRAAGSVAVVGANALGMVFSTLRADAGDVVVQARGVDVLLQAATLLAANNVSVEAARGIDAGGATSVSAQSTLAMSAFGGDVKVQTVGLVSQTGGTGDVSLRASGNVTVSGASTVENRGTGDVALTAFGGNVTVEPAGTLLASVVRNYGSRDTKLSASGDVIVAGASDVRSDGRDVALRSTGGAISLLGDSTVAAPLGALDLRASSSVAAAADAGVAQGPLPALDGASILIAAGAGGVSLVADPITSHAGAFTAIADGAAHVGSQVTAFGTLSVQSVSESVDVSGQTFSTGTVGGKSGDVLVETFAGSRTAIDARNATIRSGDHPTASGDVTLRIHAPGAAASGGAIVPIRAKAKAKQGDPLRTQLKINGVIDTGAASVDLTGASHLTVGDLEFDLQLTADSRGRPTHRDANLTLRLTPSKAKSSRVAFSLKVVGDVRGFLDASHDGAVGLRLTRGGLDAVGTVRLVGGAFADGARPGARIAPLLHVAKAHATVKPGAKDTLDLVLGFTTTGAPPSSAPDVTVSFGSFGVTLPASSFTSLGGGRFEAKDASKAVQSLVLDYAAETVTLRARKAELGDVAAGATLPVACGLTLGADARTVTIRVAHRGSALIY